MTQTFYEFHEELKGYKLFKKDKKGNPLEEVPKFIPYWSGLSIDDVKIKYYLKAHKWFLS